MACFSSPLEPNIVAMKEKFKKTLFFKRNYFAITFAITECRLSYSLLPNIHAREHLMSRAIR